MDNSTALAGLAHLSGLLVRDHDPMTVVLAGLAEACAAVGADAGGVVVASPSGDLEVLGSTSHRAADLEAYQAGSERGPCVDCVQQGEPVSVSSPAQAEDRWPGFGVRMRDAGYERAHAVPMTWHGEGIGGLNLFWRRPGSLDVADREVLQLYADILTIAVVHVRPVPIADALERLRGALASRAVLEQAKGVLAHQRDLDMGEAYDALVDLAGRRGLTLGDAARAVVDGARRGEPL
jgi:GAF domain-containing protein